MNHKTEQMSLAAVRYEMSSPINWRTHHNLIHTSTAGQCMCAFMCINYVWRVESTNFHSGERSVTMHMIYYALMWNMLHSAIIALPEFYT